MKRCHILQIPVFALALQAAAVEPPAGLVSLTGDQSVILHWDRSTDTAVTGYRVYSAPEAAGPFALLSSTGLTDPGYCDLSVANGQTNYYRVSNVTADSQESAPSAPVLAVAQPFAGDDQFLDYVQRANFDYFWYGANPANGLVPDRSEPTSPCSIAAVGFGLTAIGIGIDHGWITRAEGAERVLTALNTFLQGPQGSAPSGTIGYKGWFYHFLDMNSALRYTPFNSELSSIDTALFLAGVLYDRQYFDRTNDLETQIQTAADALFNRVDWSWMAQGGDVLSMGWRPESGFISSKWVGYNEAMLLYCLGLGAPTNPLPASAWTRWTAGYAWATNYGQAFVPFPPLFGHQYSHCWLDFRHVADAYMNAHQSTYFENSRRATLAQRAYCIANPLSHVGYSSNVWGLTACDGPTGYAAHGAPPAQDDDGTIAPTAAAGSIAFTPEYSLPTLEYFYSHFRPRIWTAYGFRDAFNIGAQWWGPDELGIDQGPIVLMIENYRTQRVWRLFMRDPAVERGLLRAGFAPLPFVRPVLEALPGQEALRLVWDATIGSVFQVEYSPDLTSWFGSPTGELSASGPNVIWTDDGPPGTPSVPLAVPQRYYRVFQFGLKTGPPN